MTTDNRYSPAGEELRGSRTRIAEAHRDAAAKVYAHAAAEMSEAILTWVKAKTRQTYPGAVALHVQGDRNDRGDLILRCLSLDGVQAFDGDDGEVLAKRQSFCAEVEPYLNWLHELEPDDWSADHVISLLEA